MPLDLGSKRARDCYFAVGASAAWHVGGASAARHAGGDSTAAAAAAARAPRACGRMAANSTAFLYCIESGRSTFDTADILHDLHANGMTLTMAYAATFAELASTVQDKRAHDYTRHLLHRLCSLSHPADFSMPPGMQSLPPMSSTVFLTAFAVSLHPGSVFQDPGAQTATPLRRAAVALLHEYEGLCAALLCHADAPGCPTARDVGARFPDFTRTLYTYLHEFKAWKMPEESMLVASRGSRD
jgi:hypothetical protein